MRRTPDSTELLTDEHARVPFSLIAVLLLLTTIFTISIQREVQQTRLQAELTGLEIELVEELAESSQVIISTTAHSTAMRTLESYADSSVPFDMIEETFSRDVERTLRSLFPEDENRRILVEGYSIHLKSDSIHFSIDPYSMVTIDTARFNQSGTDHDRAAEEVTVDALYRLFGEAFIVVTTPGGSATFERQVVVDEILEVPAPLASDRMTILEGKLSDPDSGLARIVKDVLTSLAQQRALGGWGAWERDPANPSDADWSPNQNVDNLITEEDVELAVTLGLVLLTAREFRVMESAAALASVHQDLPGLVESYMDLNNGSIQPARIAMVINDLIPAPGETSMDSFDFDDIVQRIVLGITDFYIELLFKEFFRGFDGIAAASEDAGGPNLWQDFLNGLSGEDHNSNVFQEFVRNAYLYADEKHGALDFYELFSDLRLTDLTPHLYLLADGTPNSSATTRQIRNLNFSPYTDHSNTWWETDGSCQYWDGDRWRSGYRYQEKVNTVTVDTSVYVEFTVVDAFEVGDDQIWKDSADQFVGTLDSSSGVSSLQLDFTNAILDFVDQLLDDISTPGGSGPVYPYTDMTIHPVMTTMQNFEEGLDVLINTLTGQSGITYLRQNLIDSLYNIVVNLFEQVTDFFTSENYDLLTGWYGDGGGGFWDSILDWLGIDSTSHLEAVRKKAAQGLRDAADLGKDDTGPRTNCRSSAPGNTYRDTEASKQAMYNAWDSSSDSGTWANVLDPGINNEYEELKEEDLERLGTLEDLWRPAPNWWDSPIGSEMESMVVSSTSGGESGQCANSCTFVDLVIGAATNLLDAMNGTFAESNLLQEVTVRDGAFTLWTGEFAAAEHNLTVRSAEFELVGTLGLNTLGSTVYSDEDSESIAAQIEQRRNQFVSSSTEGMYIYRSEPNAHHVADLLRNNVDAVFHTDYNLTIVGRKQVVVKTEADVIRTSDGSVPLQIARDIDIDLTIQIPVTTAWPMFNPLNTSAKLAGHVLVDKDSSVATFLDDSLWDNIREVWAWITDILDLIIELILNPSGAIVRLAGELLKAAVALLVEGLGDLLRGSLGSALASKVATWMSDPSLLEYQSYSFFGFKWQWCYPGFSSNNERAVPTNPLETWCKDEIMGRDALLHVRIAHESMLGSTGFMDMPVGTVLSLFLIETVNQQNPGYTIVANVTRVTDSYYVGATIDPLKEVSGEHSLLLDQYKDETWRPGEDSDDGYELHLHAPHNYASDFLRVSTRNIPAASQLTELTIGTKRVGVELGFEFRYDAQVMANPMDTLWSIVEQSVTVAVGNIDWPSAHQSPKEALAQFIRTLIDEFLRQATAWLQAGIEEVTFFIEGYYGAAFSSGRTGVRVAFTVGNDAVGSVLQWVADSISFYLVHLGEAHDAQPIFPAHIVDDLWVSVGLLTGTADHFVLLDASCNIPMCRSLIDDEHTTSFDRLARFRFLELEYDSRDGWEETVWGYGSLQFPLQPSVASRLVEGSP